ncbi:MAG: ABC transporter permease [Acidobacteriaceae bacterium]|nr:ABC transporter permease [Acidobacteriaceae bacterium]MBV9297015.1 ABC transporter permease [Acidobacteriaceae bacterium]
MKRFLPEYAAAAYLFLYSPLVVLGIFSFNSSKVAIWRGFTWDWYIRVFQNSALLDATLNSLIIACAATLVSTIIGTLAGYALWKKRSPILTNSLYLSLMTPEIVAGVSLLAFFEWLFRFLHVQLGMHTVILAHVSFCLVYVVIVILARLRTFDSSFEEAALDLGATEWQVFRYVTVPMLLPGIIAAALLCFTVSFDDYVITSLVAGVNSETLPMVIYAMARKGVSPEVNALSVMITVGLGVLILLAGRLEQRSGGKARRP